MFPLAGDAWTVNEFNVRTSTPASIADILISNSKLFSPGDTRLIDEVLAKCNPFASLKLTVISSLDGDIIG